jgi:hypothetical protein
MRRRLPPAVRKFVAGLIGQKSARIHPADGSRKAIG